jgi:hypothetical protein
MSKLYLQHDYKVTGRDYVETEGGDTPAGGISYSTEERVIGKWIDDKPLYQITIELPTPVTVNANSWTTVADVSGLYIKDLVSTIGKPSENQTASLYGFIDSGNLKVNMFLTWQLISVTIQYTKTTD